jgi:hypothetical protein
MMLAAEAGVNFVELRKAEVWTAVGASTIGVTPAVVRPGASNDWLDDALVLLSLLAVVGWVLLGKRLGDGC